MGTLHDRLARELGTDVLALLTERLSPSDLASLLLALAERRAAGRSPADVLAQYTRDRFVRPSRADPRVLGVVTALSLEQAAAAGFSPIAIAPLAPLGTCSSVATASQNKIVSTMRQTEVVSDPSNVLALECAARRSRDPRGPSVALATSHRTTRAQAYSRPEFSAHFELFVTAVSGRDPGDRRFEAEELARAVGVQLRLLDALAARGFRCRDRELHLSADERHAPAARAAMATLVRSWPSLPITLDPARIDASRYYRAMAFDLRVHREDDGELLPLGDGGLTDWTAKLTGSRKERFLVGAMGTELLATVSAPVSPARS